MACWAVLAKTAAAGVPDVAARPAFDLAAMRDADWPVPGDVDALLEMLRLSGALPPDV
jgi:hypothetical protein